MTTAAVVSASLVSIVMFLVALLACAAGSVVATLGKRNRETQPRYVAARRHPHLPSERPKISMCPGE